jgi:hypothetical protein
MFQNWWDRDRNRPAFHDRAFRRAELPAWDARWQTLSTAARKEFLQNLKTTRQYSRTRTSQPPVSAERFSAAALEELIAAGFVTVRDPIGREKARQAALVDGAVDFMDRLRALRRYHLLDAGQPSEFLKYVNYCFTKYELAGEINHILDKAGLNPHMLYGDVYELYVTRHRWPGWVVQYLDDSLAEAILDVIEIAGGRLPLVEIARRLHNHKPADVRGVLEKLITHLALFEDLDPETYEIQIGSLPSVLTDREQAGQPRSRPPLEPSPPPREPGPEGGSDVPDLRAVLLELAGGRARLRQDHSLFQKETERFESVLEPLPGWLADMYHLTPPRRLEIALHWAKRLELTHEKKESDHRWLDLSEHGRHWLACRVEEQYAFIYQSLRKAKRSADPYDSWEHEYDDGGFLGVPVSAIPAKAGPRRYDSWGSSLTPEQRQPLREALHAAFHELPVGVFHRLDNFAAHALFGPHNPLLLGRKPEQVQVRIAGRYLAPLEEQLREAARHLLGQMVSNRLISLGCLQAGRDADGELLIARRPRLEVYFGHDSPEAEAPDSAAATRVVVQPDFSVIVIGVDLSPVAELVAFCERVRERSGSGAVTLRITRASILRAATAGLSGAEILDRLRRHSSTPLPGNVVHEVREWAGWVRSVSAESVVLFRCPDAATADRVAAALGRGTEKLTETIVSYPSAPLNDAERRKLLEQGILISRREGAPIPKGGGKKRRRQ